jgi:uncharacterized surface protein with fasciclin (FAS1) repeats
MCEISYSLILSSSAQILKLAISGQFHGPITELQDYNGKVTLFVPNDAAIEKIPVDKLKDLQQDVQKLHQVIINHVTPGNYISCYTR